MSLLVLSGHTRTFSEVAYLHKLRPQSENAAAEGVCDRRGRDSAVACFLRTPVCQHGKSEYRRRTCDRRYTCLTSGVQDLPDGTAFACGDCIYVGSRVDSLSLRKVGHSEEADLYAKNPENECSENIDESNSELSDFILKRAGTSENA